MFLVNMATISPQTLSVSANKNNIADLLNDNYGVKINSDIVYDLRSNETVNFGNFYLPYPFWINAPSANKQSPIMSKINSVVVPWANSISIDSNKIKDAGFTETDLLKTTKFGGTQDFTASLRPDNNFTQTGFNEKTIAVSLESESGSKIVIAGNSDFLTSQLASNSPENLSFAIGSLSWMAQSQSLAGIRIKSMEQRKMVFDNSNDTSTIKFGNLAFIFIAPFVYGAWRIYQRKKKHDIEYELSE